MAPVFDRATPPPVSGTSPLMLLTSGDATLCAHGAASAVAEDVPQALRLLARTRARSGMPQLVLGALPFDRLAPAHLYVPASVSRGAPPRDPARTVLPRALSIHEQPSRADYERSVASVVDELASAPDVLQKVVLARCLVVRTDGPIDPRALVARLRRDPSVTTFCLTLPSADGNARALVGATPELLLRRRGDTLLSSPLAGSARRSPDPALDRRAAEMLRASAKDAREHASVVEWIADTLAPWCAELDVPTEPSLVSTQTMWHLGTRITARLKRAAPSALELADMLRGTPAVCGCPEMPAREAIRRAEPFDRGFFAGTIGWCDADGDGDWMVTIRCADVSGCTARLYAGAGIVEGSVPSAEADETAAKFEALLQALGITTADAPREDMQR